MFGLIYDFLYNSLMSNVAGGTAPYTFMTRNITIFGYGFSFGQYFCLVGSLIFYIVIIILCCALIKKIYNICAHIIG